MIHTRALSLAACALFLIAAGPAQAQELSQSITRRAVRAAVKLTVEAPGSRPDQPRTSTGSGSIIDPRGYVLTNFHVVGNTTPGNGVPGSLFNPNNEVRIAMVDSARDTATVRYLGRVVRADVRLDLALIRIVSDVQGNPLPAGTRFSAIPLANTAHLRPGTRLYAFGFPLGVHTINVTGGEMSGFQMNSRDEVSWIRTDAEFNPGNSGGMLLDRQGRLVAVPTAVLSGRGTLEPIELARPVDRIPADWRRDLRRGHLEETRIDGIPELAMGELAHEAVGDSSSFDRPEMHYFRLPAQRPLRIDVSPALTIGLLAANGFVVREGQGQISIGANDPPNMVLGMMIPAREESGGGTLAIRIRTRPGPAGMPGWDDMPPPRPTGPSAPANP